MDLALMQANDAQQPPYDGFIHLSINVHLDKIPSPSVLLTHGKGGWLRIRRNLSPVAPDTDTTQPNTPDPTRHLYILQQVTGFSGLECCVMSAKLHRQWWVPMIRPVIHSAHMNTQVMLSMIDTTDVCRLPFRGAQFEQAMIVSTFEDEYDSDSRDNGQEEQEGQYMREDAHLPTLRYRYTRTFEPANPEHQKLRKHFLSIATQFADTIPTDFALPVSRSRGMVVCANHDEFVSTWAHLQAVRDAAQSPTEKLPVEWFYVEGELLPSQREIIHLHAPEVTLVEWSERLPTWWMCESFDGGALVNHRELFRVYALATCSFEEVLWVDGSRSHVVGDACAILEYVRGTEPYQKHGYYVWSHPAADIPSERTASFRLPECDVGSFLMVMGVRHTCDTGTWADTRQLVIDRRRCGRAIGTWLFYQNLQRTVFAQYVSGRSASVMWYVAWGQARVPVEYTAATHSVLCALPDTSDSLSTPQVPTRHATALCDTAHTPLFVHRDPRRPITINILEEYTQMFTEGNWALKNAHLASRNTLNMNHPIVALSPTPPMQYYMKSVQRSFHQLRSWYTPHINAIVTHYHHMANTRVQRCFGQSSRNEVVYAVGSLRRVLAQLHIVGADGTQTFVHNCQMVCALCGDRDRDDCTSPTMSFSHIRKAIETHAQDHPNTAYVDEWMVVLLCQHCSLEDSWAIVQYAQPTMQLRWVVDNFANGRLTRAAQLDPLLEKLLQDEVDTPDEDQPAAIREWVRAIVDDHSSDALQALLLWIDTRGLSLPRYTRPRYLKWARFSSYTDANTCEFKRQMSTLHRHLFGLAANGWTIASETTRVDDRNNTCLENASELDTDTVDTVDAHPPMDTTSTSVSHLYRPTRRKVGFLTTFFRRDHSVARDHIGIIANLNRDLFEVTIFCDRRDTECVYFQKLASSGHRLVVLGEYPMRHIVPNSLHRHSDIMPTVNTWARVVQRADLDVLVFCDIGIREETYLLAHYRLAPVQLTTWGHSETSGIDTIDGFVSSALYDDHPDALSHYTERLIRHHSMSAFHYDHYYAYFNTLADPDPMSLPSVMHSEDPTPIVTYPHALHKVSPHDIEVFRDLLHATEHDEYPCVLALVNATGDIHKRDTIAHELAPYLSRVLMFPKRLQPGTFYKWLKQSTLVMDAYPYGGRNTTIEALYHHKVVITRPSPYLRGRFTHGLYRKLGMNTSIANVVAHSREGMVQAVLHHLRETAHRVDMETLIRENIGSLFHEVDSVREWEDMLWHGI